MSTRDLFGSDSDSDENTELHSPYTHGDEDVLDFENHHEDESSSRQDSPKNDFGSPVLSEQSNHEVEDVGEKDNAAPTQQDIFGEDIDVSSDEEPSTVLNEEDNTQTIQAEGDQVDEGVAIEIELPNVDASIGDEIYFVKLPNFLSIETKPFDPAYFEDEIDEDELQDEEGRSRLKLKVENTIRWRYHRDKENSDIKESNARVVRWSDGSLSLHMGNEIFDIFKMPIEGMQNHLFVQQGTGLQAKSVFKEKLTFRPHSTKSQTHLKMTMSIADRVSKSQKIRLIPVTERDPEAARQEMTKKEDERLRAQLRRESQQRRQREKSHSKGLTANYLESELYEDDEQELEDSLAAIKNRYKKDVKAGRLRNFKDVYSDEDSDSAERLSKAKIDDSSDEEGARIGKRKSIDDELNRKKKIVPKIIESDEESD